MPNQAGIQAKIFRGYGLAANKLGAPYTIYRPVDVTPPIVPQNIVGTILAAFDAKAAYQFTTVSLYGNDLYYGLFDGTTVHPGDYMVGKTNTFFVASMPPLTPLLCVECHRVISGTEAAPPVLLGQNPYGGRFVETDVPEFNGWPASVLEGTRGEATKTHLPGDTRAPWWLLKFPAPPGVLLSMGDRLTDDIGRAYVVSMAELTGLGWRVTAGEATT